MKHATLAAATLASLLMVTSAFGAVPDGKVAIVRVTAVDGLARWDGSMIESRSTQFSFDGMQYTIDASAVQSLENVQTLVLIDRRVDQVREGVLLRNHSQEVRTVAGDSFQVTDIPDRVFSYQVGTVGGNLRLLGDGDQISAKGGDNGPYTIWKVTSIDLLDKSAIAID